MNDLEQHESDCAMCAAVEKLNDLVGEYEDFMRDWKAGEIPAADVDGLFKAYGGMAAELLRLGFLTTISNFFVEAGLEDMGLDKVFKQ